MNQTVQHQLDDAFARMMNGDPEGVAESFWKVVANPSATDAERSDAYLGLGQYCSLVQPAFDGGHHGVGFLALALLHNPENTHALSDIVKTFDLDHRAGHVDHALRVWARRVLDQHDQ